MNKSIYVRWKGVVNANSEVEIQGTSGEQNLLVFAQNASASVSCAVSILCTPSSQQPILTESNITIGGTTGLRVVRKETSGNVFIINDTANNRGVNVSCFRI